MARGHKQAGYRLMSILMWWLTEMGPDFYPVASRISVRQITSDCLNFVCFDVRWVVFVQECAERVMIELWEIF